MLFLSRVVVGEVVAVLAVVAIDVVADFIVVFVAFVASVGLFGVVVGGGVMVWLLWLLYYNSNYSDAYRCICCVYIYIFRIRVGIRASQNLKEICASFPKIKKKKKKQTNKQTNKKTQKKTKPCVFTSNHE